MSPPVSIAHCLQGLGCLAKSNSAQSRDQWSRHGQDVANSILMFMETHATDDDGNVWQGKRANYLQNKAVDWVNQKGALYWSVEARKALLEHAPTYPDDKPAIIAFVQIFMEIKCKVDAEDARAQTRNKGKRASDAHDNHLSSDRILAQPRADGFSKFAARHSKSELKWINYTSSEVPCAPTKSRSPSPALQTKDNSTTASRNSLSFPDTSTRLNDYSTSKDSSISDHHGGSGEASLVLEGPRQQYRVRPMLGDSIQNHYRDGMDLRPNVESMFGLQSSHESPNPASSPVHQPNMSSQEMRERITFMVGISPNYGGNCYAMGMEDGQDYATFRAGVLAKLQLLDENIGYRKIVAKLEWLRGPIVVDSDHDHHLLLRTIETWPGWRLAEHETQCIVYVSPHP